MATIGEDGSGCGAEESGTARPPRASEVSYLVALTEVVSVERWMGIVEEVAAQAEDGDLRAAQWIGKPLLGADPGRLSEALAGVLADGSHYRVSEHLDRREKQHDDEDDDLLDPDADARRERVEALVGQLRACECFNPAATWSDGTTPPAAAAAAGPV